MTKDIVRKLRDHLEDGVDTECKVVYLLAEIRKILEQDRPDPKPFALWMYCHWALHVNLSYASATLQLLERIDMHVSHTVAGLTEVGTFDIFDEERLFRELIYFTAFREQLRQFLINHLLPTDICDNAARWSDFVAVYAQVIKDGEL